MTRTRFVVAAAAAALIAGSAYGLYSSAAASQHRKPPSSSQPADGQQATPPPAGHRAPDAPATGQAVPRRPDNRPQAGQPSSDRPQASQRPPDRRPRRPVIVPYPGGFGPWWGYPYGYPPQPWYVDSDWASTNIRLDVSPEDAAVYVDGYYTGTVDDYDGIFQRLRLTPGPHHIDIRKPEYVPLALDVNLEPGQTITYRRTMERKTTGLYEEPPAAPAPPVDDVAAVEPAGPPGDVRFDITPKDAEVYADGYYAGLASDFSGGSQHLVLDPGPHHIVVQADGYERVEFDMNVQPQQTVTYRRTMERKR